MIRLVMGAALAFVFLFIGAPKCSEAQAPDVRSSIRFDDVSRRSGVDFQFHKGSRGKHDLVEIMGGGVGLIDVDRDGRLDVFVCNGGPIGEGSGVDDPTCRLYRNNTDGAFTDITKRARAPGPNYAMGVAVGDVDGDGFDDLFVTGWRDQRLYRNTGNLSFEDVTAKAGLSSNLWSTSAAFADLDDDGDLDLYVASYVDFDSARAPFCFAPDGKRDYCGPKDFQAQPHRLYKNIGGGRFQDVSRQSGIADSKGGRGLGVLIADLSGDRKPDVYVANDGSPCWLFENQGGFHFNEVGARAGLAFNGDGDPMAGMGIGYGDINSDGFPDVVVSNFYNRSTIGFLQVEKGVYRDASRELSLVGPTRPVLGFGIGLVDLNGDGLLDLFQMNGHVLDRERLGEPLAMRPTLLENRRQMGLVDVGSQAGPWFSPRRLGRGLAVGDLDLDGKPDVAAASLDLPLAILRNTTADCRTFALDLTPKPPGCKNQIGLQIKVKTHELVSTYWTSSGGGYLSAGDSRPRPPVLASGKIESIEVLWHSGERELFLDAIGKNGVVSLHEGKGRSSVRPR